ncbi:acyltransferase [Sphingosinicella sp. BN140058]|uniref:acyltransferase family protein n=1 Tax=Sphingosinicella sp. BN140058 TaxID=1892855 RepID=UPI0013EC3CB7|nr:acyltransferase [Sphingosinicella sp. BN140058]
MSGSCFSPAAHGLRGIACLLVLAAHILAGAAEHVYPGDRDYVALVRIPSLFGTYGVYLFFVISGYVILPSAIRYPPREFALRRWLRIYPLFFTFSALFVILNALTNAYPKQNSLGAVLAGFLFLDLFTPTEQLTPNAWSLSYEVVFYCLTALCVHAALRTNSILLKAAAFSLAASFLLFEPISIYFLVGVVIRLVQARTGQVASRWSRLLEAPALLLALYAVTLGRHDYQWHEFDRPTLLACLLFTGLYFHLATLAGSLSGRLLANPVTAYAGTISYSLYLVHPYVYFPLREGFLRLGLFTDAIPQSMIAFSVAVTALSLAGSHVVHLYLERRPYEWFFRQRLYGRTRSPDIGPARG